MTDHGVPESPYGVLTPYPIPDELRGRKVCNLGDGFILRAIERRLGRFAADRTFSPRVALPAAAEAVIAATPAVVLAGANQLAENWTIWPGFTAARLRASPLRLVPFGVGLHGAPGHSERLSPATKEVLLAVHERIAFSSWRCPHTVDLLRRELPQLAPQLLMTGCPVVFDAPLLDGRPFGTRVDHVAVTPTERDDFFARETAIVDHVVATWPRARRTLVLHQNWSPPTRGELLRHRFWPARPERLDPFQRLRQYAVRRGFRVAAPADADALLAFYRSVDVHVGTRLHAHLHCLSQAKRSWLVPVDGRAAGIAESLDFPLCRPDTLGAHAEFDFERVRGRVRALFPVLRRFVDSLPR
ncbi:MAG: polysaccharide pyruvyl transferase family protein [Planctomycetes bacterium]|nr:polysaccharide pyruvyl transferase family protein [Planctomycetota bacterium]